MYLTIQQRHRKKTVYIAEALFIPSLLRKISPISIQHVLNDKVLPIAYDKIHRTTYVLAVGLD